jgi:opacity protein-like surface antigen
MQKLLWVVGCVLAALLIAAAPASAAVKEGDKEISVYGAVTSIDVEGFNVTLVTVQLAGGVFINDSAQLGGSITTQSSDAEGETSTSRTLAGFFKFHFNTKETTVPYVGFQAGQTTVEFGSDSESAVSYGPLAGIKFFVSENLSVNPEVDYIKTKILEVDVTITIVQVGLSYYF